MIETTTIEREIKYEVNQNVSAIQHLTVEELYDKDKYDLSTMEPGDVFILLQ
jgi:H+-transporting ATPase